MSKISLHEFRTNPSYPGGLAELKEREHPHVKAAWDEYYAITTKMDAEKMAAIKAIDAKYENELADKENAYVITLKLSLPAKVK